MSADAAIKLACSAERGMREGRVGGEAIAKRVGRDEWGVEEKSYREDESRAKWGRGGNS